MYRLAHISFALSFFIQSLCFGLFVLDSIPRFLICHSIICYSVDLKRRVLAVVMRGAVTALHHDPRASRGTSQVTARLPSVTDLVIKLDVHRLPGVGGVTVASAQHLPIL